MALDLEVPADRPAQPRGGLPVDPADVILGAVFAQRFERRAGAAPAIAMAARLPQQGAPLGQLGRPGVRQVGQAADLQAGRQPLLRPGEPERPANPVVEIAERGHAALGRNQLVVERRAGPGRHVDLQRGRLGASPVGHPIGELQRQREPAVVLHDPGDAVGLIDVKLARRLAIEAQARPPAGQQAHRPRRRRASEPMRIHAATTAPGSPRPPRTTTRGTAASHRSRRAGMIIVVSEAPRPAPGPSRARGRASRPRPGLPA